ncbi:hypothetical protein EHH60_01860 [Bradyrhizobium sp. RP6]|nr:hypothetical protein EHH60_01860 [Bradyrhizobium sp. RP6]
MFLGERPAEVHQVRRLDGDGELDLGLERLMLVPCTAGIAAEQEPDLQERGMRLGEEASQGGINQRPLLDAESLRPTSTGTHRCREHSAVPSAHREPDQLLPVQIPSDGLCLARMARQGVGEANEGPSVVGDVEERRLGVPL